jgi:lipoate-protein ligase A
MSDTWFFLRDRAQPPSWNMAFDEALLEIVQEFGRPVLRLYGWKEPAATFGYFQKYHEVETWTSLRPLIRRPTGGGLVPHDADWTYSLVFPPHHAWYGLRAEESYRRVHEWISDSFRELRVAAALSESRVKAVPGQCFVGAEKFDVLASGRKIAGAAQKRNKLGLLIQGSIQPSIEWSRENWEEALLRSAVVKFGVQRDHLPTQRDLFNRAETLDKTKYGTAAYNQRR